MTAHSDSSTRLDAPGPLESGSTSTGRSQTFRAIREIVETLLLAALIFFLVRLVVLNFKVDGQSMTPNLHNEQMLLVNRNAYQHIDLQGYTFYPFDPPERGDIVVFNPPTESEKPYIKRIIGLPGDEVTFGNGHVFVNGEMLEEDYIRDRTNCRRNEYCDVVVPPGTVYVLGDHRTNSSDSRVFGPVPIENVIGKAWLSYWPVSDIGFVPHEEYPGIPDPIPQATPAA
jgi:signal peptidase I